MAPAAGSRGGEPRAAAGGQETAAAGVVEALASLLGARSSASPARAEEWLPLSRCNYFVGQRAATISVDDYLRRLLRHFECSQSCLVLVAVYIDRILRQRRDVEVSERTVHRLILASMTVAAKFNDDRYLSNAWYARIGGVGNRELNLMEAELLQMIGWRVHVSSEEFERYHGLLQLEAQSAARRRAPPEAPPQAAAAPEQATTTARPCQQHVHTTSAERSVGAPDVSKPAPPPLASEHRAAPPRACRPRRARPDGGACAPGCRARPAVSSWLRLVLGGAHKGVRRACRLCRPSAKGRLVGESLKRVAQAAF